MTQLIHPNGVPAHDGRYSVNVHEVYIPIIFNGRAYETKEGSQFLGNAIYRSDYINLIERANTWMVLVVGTVDHIHVCEVMSKEKALKIATACNPKPNDSSITW